MTKEQLIYIFLRKGNMYLSMKSSILKTKELVESSCPNILPEDLKKLREKYTIEEYIRRLTPIIDEMFTIEEMEEIVKFYTIGVGRKIFDPDFLQKVGKIGKNIFLEMESDYLRANAKKKNI